MSGAATIQILVFTGKIVVSLRQASWKLLHATHLKFLNDIINGCQERAEALLLRDARHIYQGGCTHPVEGCPEVWRVL